jgi:hypothetical protein
VVDRRKVKVAVSLALRRQSGAPVPTGRRSSIDAGRSVPVPLINQPEIDMSADKDRGVRRQKQKRAKDLKKQAKQQKPGGPERSPASTPSNG